MKDLRSMALGFAVIASGLIVVNSVEHMNDRPFVPGYVWSARVATPPMPAPDAFLCEFGCPGFGSPITTMRRH